MPPGAHCTPSTAVHRILHPPTLSTQHPRFLTPPSPAVAPLRTTNGARAPATALSHAHKLPVHALDSALNSSRLVSMKLVERGTELALAGTREQRKRAQWKNWARADGTNVTWSNELLHAEDIKIWTRKEAERRRSLAAESTDIDVSILNNIDIHLIQTQYRQHAIEEKLKRHAAQPAVNMEEWTKHNMALALADENDADESEDGGGGGEDRVKKRSKKNSKTKLPSSSASSSSSHTYPRTSGTAAASVRIQRLSTSGDVVFSQAAPIAASSPKGKGKQKAVHPTTDVRDAVRYPLSSLSTGGKKRAVSPSFAWPVEEPKLSGRGNKRLRVRVENQGLFRLRELEKQWCAIARKAHAAAIKFINEVDEEEIPPLAEDFQYIEAGYH
ncbi:hypothetical protein C0993_000841 [Termitomyces sp. T159_Od127]|nr:hypothetical protein C0993_000841 [Termitomyces sp. T159_Od127]